MYVNLDALYVIFAHNLLNHLLFPTVSLFLDLTVPFPKSPFAPCPCGLSAQGLESVILRVLGSTTLLVEACFCLLRSRPLLFQCAVSWAGAR